MTTEEKNVFFEFVENLKKKVYYDIHDDYDGYVRNALDKVVSFVKSMQDEPINEDFEKEVEKMWAQESKCRDTDYTIAELTKQDYEDCARHFANWQKQKDVEVLLNHAKCIDESYKKGIKIGKAEMKQQMMKNAICTTMQEDDCGDIVPTIVNQKGFKVGDKVKIIILKE